MTKVKVLQWKNREEQVILVFQSILILYASTGRKRGSAYLIQHILSESALLDDDLRLSNKLLYGGEALNTTQFYKALCLTYRILMFFS